MSQVTPHENNLTPAETRQKLPDFLDLVRKARHVAIGTHLNPDGDALGSALAVSLILDQLGVAHTVLCQHPAPSNLAFLPGTDRIRNELPGETPDLAVILDLDAMNRLGTVRHVFDDVPHKIVVDHHIPQDAPGDLRIISTKSPATCAILCDLFFDSEVTITPEIANCLLTGILTDTGSFRYPNTTSHSLHLSAQLLEAGASISGVSEEVYMKKTLPSVRILGRSIERAKITSDGRLTWVTIPYEVFDELNASDQDTEGIVNEMLSIRGVEIAAILREIRPGKIRGSLRSRAHINVADVAQLFGGGGHKNASGISFDGSLLESEIRIVEALKACLASSS